LAKNLSKVTGAQKDYLRKVRESCGLQKMSDTKKLNLRRLEEQFDFRILGKAKLDGVVNNARLLSENKDVKKYIKIVLSSRKRSTVVKKFKEYLRI